MLKNAGLEHIDGHNEQLVTLLTILQEWWQIVWNSGFRGPVPAHIGTARAVRE